MRWFPPSLAWLMLPAGCVPAPQAAVVGERGTLAVATTISIIADMAAASAVTSSRCRRSWA